MDERIKKLAYNPVNFNSVPCICAYAAMGEEQPPSNVRTKARSAKAAYSLSLL